MHTFGTSTGQLVLQHAGPGDLGNAGAQLQLQDFGGHISAVPIVLQDGTVFSVLPQNISTSAESVQAPLQLQSMQQQQPSASGSGMPVLLQDGSVMLLMPQQASTDSANIISNCPAPLALQARQQQQQQVIVISQDMGAHGASTSSGSMLVLQGSAGMQLPVSLRLLDQQVDMPQQQQQNQPVYALASGSQLGSSSSPMQQNQVMFSESVLISGAGSSALQLQDASAQQMLSCAGQQQVILCAGADAAGSTMQQVQLQGLDMQQQQQLPAGQHVLMSARGMQGQIVQVQGPQGQIMQGTLMLQVRLKYMVDAFCCVVT
jgi:hypothetical protein